MIGVNSTKKSGVASTCLLMAIAMVSLYAGHQIHRIYFSAEGWGQNAAFSGGGVAGDKFLSYYKADYLGRRREFMVVANCSNSTMSSNARTRHGHALWAIPTRNNLVTVQYIPGRDSATYTSLAMGNIDVRYSKDYLPVLLFDGLITHEMQLDRSLIANESFMGRSQQLLDAVVSQIEREPDVDSRPHPVLTEYSEVPISHHLSWLADRPGENLYPEGGASAAADARAAQAHETEAGDNSDELPAPASGREGRMP